MPQVVDCVHFSREEMERLMGRSLRDCSLDVYFDNLSGDWAVDIVDHSDELAELRLDGGATE